MSNRKDSNQGPMFHEGRGRGFEIREQKKYAETNKERTVPVLIDLGDLNKPGVGPVNYDPAKGSDFDQPRRKGGSDGDDDKDMQVF